MLTPDLDRARRFLTANPPPGELLLCGVTGSHMYGFPSADSDVDIKGIHLAPLTSVLGLDKPQEAYDRLEFFEDVEHDLTTHELSRALGLLLQGNGNVLERILTPIQIVESEDVDALRELARGAISKRFVGHYRGFFKGCRREHEIHRRAKTLLYSYRVALTGAHLLKTGVLNANLVEIAPQHGFESVLELVDVKRAGREKEVLDETMDARHTARWDELDAYIQTALTESTLPDEPANREAMDAWVVNRRRRQL